MSTVLGYGLRHPEQVNTGGNPEWSTRAKVLWQRGINTGHFLEVDLSTVEVEDE